MSNACSVTCELRTRFGEESILQELRRQLCEMRDFLEIELSHHREVLDNLNNQTAKASFQSASRDEQSEEQVDESECEIEERQSNTFSNDVVQTGENIPAQAESGGRSSFVEAALLPIKAKAQMQSYKLRVSKNAVAARQEVLEKTWRTKVNDTVFSPGFSGFITVLILVNVILLGVEVDVSASLELSEVPSWFGTVNAIIVFVFVIEIGLKLFALGCREFWRGRDATWNILDFVIVSISVADVSLDLLAHMLSSSSLNTGHLRLVRSIRLARALRGVKVVRIFRYITALRTLALSIISTMGSLFWTLMLLIMVFYFFAVVITQLVTDHCRNLRSETDAKCSDLLQKYWASVGESMLTLFMAITNGVSWDDAIRPLREFSYVAVAFVCAYITIAVFAILNVVTGVFCNTAIESAHADKEVATIKQVHTKDQQVEALRSVFQEIDSTHSSEVSFQDVQDAISSGELSSFMEAMGISTDDIWTLCMLLDADKNGRIDLDEFVSGCMQLHGPAKSLQLAKMSMENKLTRRAIRTLTEEMLDLKSSLRGTRSAAAPRREVF
ncbi:unnamed protein product [Durusdinium trenchii]|uniref:EF-hand domain-containing protein n=2 Tax=Durusdinium trenchii TaxID=1381693 RepID=A0ABP0RQ91_9DINO